MFCAKCVSVRGSGRFSAKLMVKNKYCSDVNGRKTIDDIPSPAGLPIIGTTLSLLLAGSTPKLHWYINKRHQKLGPIFKERIGPVPCVFISDPEVMRAVFANEGKYPIHVLPEAWTTYNKLHNVSRGLFFMNGQEWLHFRRIMNPLLLKGDQLWIEDSCKPAAENLIRKLNTISKENKATFRYPDVEKLLYQWSLEVIVSVLLGPKKFRIISDELEEKIKCLAFDINLIFETSSKLSLMSSETAARYQFRRWKKFESAVTTALNSVNDLVRLLSDKYATDDDGLLNKLKPQMTLSELSNIVTDLIVAAGDTTAYSMEWILYLVGKNREAQKRLRIEIMKSSKENQKPINGQYLKNTIKEALRLYPVAPFLTRILPQPCTIGGYDLPAGTVAILSIFTTGRDSKYFPDPDNFNPDRWIRDKNQNGVIRSACMPFAIGARSCIGKKLAETQLHHTLAEIVANFDIEICNKKNVDVILKMVAVPSQPIQFKFNPIK